MAELLVQKPQFDIKTLGPGTPIQLTISPHFLNMNSGQRVKTGLTTKAEPLKLTIQYWKEADYCKEAYMADFVIDVENVASGRLTIEILKPSLDRELVETRLRDLITSALNVNQPQDDYIRTMRTEISILARVLSIEPENIMPDLFKEAKMNND